MDDIHHPFLLPTFGETHPCSHSQAPFPAPRLKILGDASICFFSPANLSAISPSLPPRYTSAFPHRGRGRKERGREGGKEGRRKRRRMRKWREREGRKKESRRDGERRRREEMGELSLGSPQGYHLHNRPSPALGTLKGLGFCLGP